MPQLIWISDPTRASPRPSEGSRRVSLPNPRLCVTSHPEIDIRTALGPLTSRSVSLHNQIGQKKDIVDYVTSLVYSDARMQRWRDEDKKLVIETLSERADGM